MRLTSLEAGWGARIGAALIPVDDRQLFGGVRQGADMGGLLAAQVAAAALGTALVLRAALLLVHLAPLWYQGRPKTFAGLPAAEREALLEALLKHPVYVVRQLLSLLKLFCCIAFMGDRALLAQMGAYDLGGKP